MYKFRKKSKKNTIKHFIFGKTKCVGWDLGKGGPTTYGRECRHVPTYAKWPLQKSTVFPEKIDRVNLIYQYYLTPNKSIVEKARQKELEYCLQKHIANRYIDRIYLLVERLYTSQELGLREKGSTKIRQINIGRRATFSDIFQTVKLHNIQGYIIFSNADIFYDQSLANIFRSELFYKKSIFCQARLDTDKNAKHNAQCWSDGAMHDAWFHPQPMVSLHQTLYFILTLEDLDVIMRFVS